MRPDEAQIRRWLSEVPDPEIPVISVLDLGVIRDLAWEGERLVVGLAPTYTGCPAASVIAFEVEAKLRHEGVGEVRIERRLSPPWSTDWIAPEAREKLRAYGIAPPVDGTAASGALAGRIARLGAAGAPQVACPRCGSLATEEVSRHGSTPCKAAWRCRDCLEPFDYFKCI